MSEKEIKIAYQTSVDERKEVTVPAESVKRKDNWITFIEQSSGRVIRRRPGSTSREDEEPDTTDEGDNDKFVVRVPRERIFYVRYPYEENDDEDLDEGGRTGIYGI